MESISGEVTTRELRAKLSEVLGRVMYGDERIGITRNGKLAAIIVSVADLEEYEAFEAEYDQQLLRGALAEDDGTSITLEDYIRGLGEE